MKRCLLFAAAALALAAGAPALAHEPLGDEIAALSRRIQAGTAGPAEYLRRGELFRLSGDFAEAKADYDRAERLDPTRAEIHSCRGALLSDLGQPRHAASELDRYLELRPRSRDALALRARVAMALGRAWEAVPFLSRALTVGPATPDLYLERARIQAALPGGHVDEAVQGLREGIARLGPVVGLELYAANLERGTSHAAMTAGGAARARVAPSAPARGATAPSAPPPNVSRRTARVVTRVLPRRSAAAAALASPIVTRGPYLQEGTSSSVIVRWRTDRRRRHPDHRARSPRERAVPRHALHVRRRDLGW